MTKDLYRLYSRVPISSSSPARVVQFKGSLMEQDNKGRIVLNGRARLKKFVAQCTSDWPSFDLPLVPAMKSFGGSQKDFKYALLVQLPFCNLRCWFCFVDYSLLTGSEDSTSVLDTIEIASELVNGKLNTLMISGGEPLFAIEWISTLHKKLTELLGGSKPYLWIETNLTVDIIGINETHLKFLKDPMVGVVGCLKSYWEEGFRANIDHITYCLANQMEIASRLISIGTDLYLSVVLAGPIPDSPELEISRFFDSIEKSLPSFSLERMYPVEVRSYTPMKNRLKHVHFQYIKNQYEILPYWLNEKFSRINVKEDLD